LSLSRLKPADYAFAVSYSEVTRARGRESPLQSERGKRTIRDADLHKLFKTGRTFPRLLADGTVKLDAAGRQVVHRLTKMQALRCIALVTLVKKIAGPDPYFQVDDASLADRAQRDLGEDWTVEVVRNTRRLCFMAGLEVRPVTTEMIGTRQLTLTGSVWVLDRRRLAVVENAVPLDAQGTTGVVATDQASSIRGREKPFSLRSNGTQKRQPRAGPGPGEASAVVKAALRELRSEERRRRRAQPTTSERLSDEPLAQTTRNLVLALFVERRKVRFEWGDRPALDQAADRAVALGADQDLVAQARAHWAAEILGEQLRLEEAGGGP
jgi:hypothetical protein